MLMAQSGVVGPFCTGLIKSATHDSDLVGNAAGGASRRVEMCKLLL